MRGCGKDSPFTEKVQCKHINESSVSCEAERLLAFDEGLCSMQFITGNYHRPNITRGLTCSFRAYLHKRIIYNLQIPFTV